MRSLTAAATAATGSLEGHGEFDGRMTRRLGHRLVTDAQVMTIRAVARRHGVSWPVINSAQLGATTSIPRDRAASAWRLS